MKTALAGTKVRHYHGIDLSEPALELAAANLAAMPFQVDLDHRDFVEAMMRRPEHADAAWCSLSIHHLADQRQAAPDEGDPRRDRQPAGSSCSTSPRAGPTRTGMRS